MYVVTGGAGFIGSNIVHGLEARGLGPVAVVDHIDSNEKARNIAKRRDVETVTPEDLSRFLDANAGRIRGIIHMGAISATTETRLVRIIKNNIILSRRLWDWCTAQGVPYIYASSAATYGDGNQGFDDDGAVEALKALKPLNMYGWSKNQFDIWVAEQIAAGAPRPPGWAGLKFFNVFGPNEYHKGRMQSVARQVYEKAARDEACTLFKSHNPDYPDGGQLRDFVWVGDCVDMVLWLLDHPEASGLFNCGAGKARSFADLAAAVYRALGKEPMINFVPTPEDIRDKYQYFTEARMDRIRAAGYAHPQTPLEEGVRRYVQDFLAAGDPYL
ncbi:ADP-glyceromanno-heptose 6-epimerase [bacterium SCSIO 12827]|nr:ADP-glyceromanno-heptose 6-epimerase [bacterium SCSIO 12827]